MVEKQEIEWTWLFSGKKIINIEDLAGIQILDAFWFPIDISYAPRKIPLNEIFLDLQNFQNRNKAYSENSVNNIIDAVLKWNFDLRIFDRTILRRNPDTWMLYVLAWHSRLEAFIRLSTEHKDHPKVYEIEKRFNFSFASINSIIMDNISFDDARFIALMSNALATIETYTERAEIYRTFRDIGQKNKFIEEFGRKCEKTNRPRIDAYSFLNRNGLAIQSLENFENNHDDSSIIKRIALWIGNIRKKHRALSNLHEGELTEWLLQKWWYGNQSGQVDSQSKFFEIVEWQIHRLQENGELNPDKKLNILKLKSISLAMKEYYHLLDQLREKKKIYIMEFHTKRRNINKSVVRKAEHGSWLDLFRKELLQEIKSPVELLNKIEQAEMLLFDLESHISESNIQTITDRVLGYINSIEQDYYKLKNDKDKFMESWKNELYLFE